MGTLTADCPRLDDHCPHKLATSCRLTSTLNCCACADERPHSRTYRVYIDGVGFVQRGTRWQGYCWFCKEFWNNRIAATEPPLEINQTRIPHIPDQSEFIERWNEFHQGFRTVTTVDGTERQISVVAEDFKEVSPGFLPRTLDQLRRRVPNDAQRAENIFRRRRLTSEEERPEEPQETIEDALDNLLDDASDEETAPVEEAPSVVEVPQPTEPISLPTRTVPNTRGGFALDRQQRVEAIRQRNRERFARIYGTQEEIAQDDYESPIATMYGRAMRRYTQAEQSRSSGVPEPPAASQASPREQLAAALRERRDLERQIIEREMLQEALIASRRTVLGIRSEDREDSEDFTPTGSMVARDGSRNGDGEITPTNASDSMEARDSDVFAGPHDESSIPDSDDSNDDSIILNPRRAATNRLAPLRSSGLRSRIIVDSNAEYGSASSSQDGSERDRPVFPTTANLRGDPQQPRRSLPTGLTPATSGPATSSAAAPTSPTAAMSAAELRMSIEQLNEELLRIRQATNLVTGGRLASLMRRGLFEEPELDMDKQDRPEPLEDEQMTRTLACQVCYCQLADVALLPCGHMVLCGWCADTVIPVKHSHVPIRPSKCPVCRKQVKQRFKIHM